MPARYVSSASSTSRPGTFPWSTFTVNVSGCFVLGVLLTLVVERWPPSQYVPRFAASGSSVRTRRSPTYTVEAVTLTKDHHADVARAMLWQSLVVGLAAVAAGVALASATRRCPRTRRADVDRHARRRGAIGAVSRYVVDDLVNRRFPGVSHGGRSRSMSRAPCLLGLVTGLALYHGLGPIPKTAIGVGSVARTRRSRPSPTRRSTCSRPVSLPARRSATRRAAWSSGSRPPRRAGALTAAL